MNRFNLLEAIGIVAACPNNERKKGAYMKLRRVSALLAVASATAVSMGAAIPAPSQASTATTVFWNQVVQIGDGVCQARAYLGIVGSNQVKRRNNWGYNRDQTCLWSDYGSWYYGAYYIGGGITTCSISGNVIAACPIDATKQADPYIKNIGVGNARGEGSFQY